MIVKIIKCIIKKYLIYISDENLLINNVIEGKMKCYLINLDRAPERLKRMTKLLQNNGVSFQRFPAIDGKNFTDNDIAMYREKSKISYNLSAGDLACGESHLQVLNLIASGADEYAVVMEDDLHLSNDIAFLLNNDSWIPRSVDIIKLETVGYETKISRNKNVVHNGRFISKLLSRHGGTGIYIVSRKAAKYLVDEYHPGMETIDDFIFSTKINELNIFQMVPAVGVQDEIGELNAEVFLKSSIHDSRSDYPEVLEYTNRHINKPQGLNKLKREILRPLEPES